MGGKSIPQGAATAPELTGQGGTYAVDCHIAEVDDESHEEGVRSYALQPQIAESLLGLSEQMVGERFTI